MRNSYYKGAAPTQAFRIWWGQDGKDYGANVLPNETTRRRMMEYAFIEGMRLAGRVDSPEVVQLLKECRSILFESPAVHSLAPLIVRIDSAIASFDSGEAAAPGEQA